MQMAGTVSTQVFTMPGIIVQVHIQGSEIISRTGSILLDIFKCIILYLTTVPQDSFQ